MKKSILFILCLLASCDFKPHYERPNVCMPNGWRFDHEKGPNDCVNFRWWEQLGDPILNELICQAMANNQNLQIATARVLEFYAKYRIIASELYPEIDFQASYLRQKLSDNLNYAPVIPGTHYNNTFSLFFTLSYEIDFWGRIRNATEAGQALYFSEIEERHLVILTLISSLASAYVQLKQYDNQLKISKLTYESRLEAWKLATLRFEGGLDSKMEVDQAESEAQSAEVEVKNLERLIPQQEDLISVLVGAPSSSVLRGPLLDKYKDPPLVPSGIPCDILQNRPDILKAELELIAANAEIGVARAAFFPAITLTGLYGVQSSSLKNILSHGSRVWDYSISALQPIFTGWRLTYQLAESEAIACELVHNYQQVILTALQEVNDALIAHIKYKEIHEIQNKQIEALKEYLKLATLRFDNGQNDYLTVLDAERRLFRVELDEAAAAANVYLSLIALYKALGGGWVLDADCTMTGGCL